jgi:UDP-3-O-[3-hydroxymyristoyl] glucosamine N-acyltransferase
MVHVGHNCDIGERVVIAAQTGISGSVVIEDDAVIGVRPGRIRRSHASPEREQLLVPRREYFRGKIVRPGVCGEFPFSRWMNTNE